MLYIKNGTLYTPHLHLERGAILLDGARIADLGPVGQVRCPAGAQVVDAEGLLIAPGFIDLQLNGGFGADFTADPTTIWTIAAQLPQYGVTTVLPTIITAPLETIAQAQAVITAGPPAGYRGTAAPGLHVEGPFLNPAKKGAHNPAHLRPPALADIAGWQVESGIQLVTLAPELPGALDLVAALKARGILVSAGHSMATLAEAEAGFEAGIGYGTHLFNAMPTLHHREPGLAGALLTHPTIKAGLIPDGLHVHPAIIDLIWRSLGPERLTLVTDAMGALGMSPGRYQLGDFEVHVDDATARLSDGTLAGSIITHDACLRNIITFTGCSLSEGLQTLTTTPAAALDMAAQKGSLAPGHDADLVLLTPDLSVAKTIVGGQIVYP